MEFFSTNPRRPNGELNMRTRIHSCACLLALLTFAPACARGAEILNEVPADSLGFVLVHNLSAVDAKVGQLATLLQRNLPRPLAFLKNVTGISDGLNADGDLMIALFPSPEGDEGRLRFCVWLPVADYDRFLNSIGATSIDGIAVASIAGEDLLIARRGEWALVMDPDQRGHIAELAAATAATSPVAAWRKWINSNDVTFVAFAPGVQELLAWTLAAPEESTTPQPAGDNPFGARNAPANRRAIVAAAAIRTPADILESAKEAARKWSAVTPGLTDAFKQANIVGCGVRLDSNNNALTSLRIALPNELTGPLLKGASETPAELPFSIYDGGGFIVNGAGRLPAPIASALTTGYLLRTTLDLNENEGKAELDEATMKRMQEAAAKAAAEVRAAVVLSQPGEEAQPVYSNEFLTLRVASAANFVTHANEVMRLWNKANRETKSDLQIVFDVEETKVGDRAATLYSLDMAALSGGAILPEIRQTMEKMFGPGGKLRFWIVPADENTVLLASATPDQINKALATLDKKIKVEWRGDQLGETSALLPAESDWRIFVDLHRYFDWSRREAGAIVGVPVIGGPLVREFPVSPPIGIAGGFRDGEIWLDAATPALTLKSADTFLTKNRSRFPVQLRARVVPAAPRPVPVPKK